MLYRARDLHLLLSTFLALADPLVLSDRHPGQQVAPTIHKDFAMEQGGWRLVSPETLARPYMPGESQQELPDVPATIAVRGSETT